MVVAKDNIDFNATSSKAVENLHDTSMTVMQFPRSENLGNSITLRECVQSTYEESKNNVLKIPETYKTVKHKYILQLYPIIYIVNISEYCDISNS